MRVPGDRQLPGGYLSSNPTPKRRRSSHAQPSHALRGPPRGTPAGRTLSERDRRIIEMKLAGHKQTVIATELGVSPPAVCQRLRALRQRWDVRGVARGRTCAALRDARETRYRLMCPGKNRSLQSIQEFLRLLRLRCVWILLDNRPKDLTGLLLQARADVAGSQLQLSPGLLCG